MKFDYLIVGSGIYGSIFAREMTNAGARCLVIDRRTHIGGNCYTKNDGGIHVHEYGPHIFHTNSERVWNYMNKWASFNHYVNRPKVLYKGELYSFPINLFTLYQLWGVKTPAEAKNKLQSVRIKIENPSNLEEWILSQVGEDIYYRFIYGYTKKQWGKHPNQLPASIIKRLPIRLTFDDNYFEDRYQGIPVNGYTEIFEKLLQDIPLELGVDFHVDRDRLESIARKVVYTGALDEFFNYDIGTLEWRSLRFEQERMNIPDFQGNALVNYTEESIPFTRICEHKHFTFGKQDHTVITREYPQQWKVGMEKFYPVNNDINDELQAKYRSRMDESRYIVGGRLADYRYYDMHHVVGSALADVKKEL